MSHTMITPRDIFDGALRFFSDTLLPAIGITMITETLIEGGATEMWLIFTAIVVILWIVANRLHEGTEDMVEELHETMEAEEEREGR